MTLALPEKTWTVFYPTSGIETVWYFFIDESAADSFYEKIRRAGYYPTKRPYHPTDAKHMTQEQAELLHAAADSVPRLTASFEEQKHGRSHPGPMRRPTCLCGAVGLRDDRYDAYYCHATGTWLEDACGDKSCSDCTSRPEKRS